MPIVHEKNNFIWLTVAMIGLMITGAVSGEIAETLTLQLVEFTSVALLLLSLLSLKTDRSWGKRFLVLIGIILTTVVVRNVTHIHYLEYFYLGLLLLFMISAAWLVAKKVLLTGRVDLNILVGSVALYMLIGYIFSILYTLLLVYSPHALEGMDVAAWYDNISTTTYFSFVTLTTLGYGDISPATPMAQTLAILEAVTGMFYIAAIVASLIGAMNRS